MYKPKKILIKDINKTFKYPIFIAKNLLKNLDKDFHKDIKNKKVFIIYDSFFKNKNTLNNILIDFQKEISKSSLSVDTIPIKGRDKNKSFFVLENLINKLLKRKIDRDSLIITLGGGVVGDIGGFASSIILRGIKMIQVPTTLLAQVDSSVGGKTGINTFLGKNLIGSFFQPSRVLIDTSLLKTLPKRELIAGFAEVLKYGFINDKKLFDYLKANCEKILKLEEPFLEKIIYKSCLIKARIVSLDEKENGIRAILNLGHTFGHAFENLLNYDLKLIHGEAVAIGIGMSFRLSYKLGLCDKKEVKKAENLLKNFKLPISIKNFDKFKFSASKVLEKLYTDKKVRNGKLTFIICDKIGNAFIKNDIDEEIIFNFLEEELNE